MGCIGTDAFIRHFRLDTVISKTATHLHPALRAVLQPPHCWGVHPDEMISGGLACQCLIDLLWCHRPVVGFSQAPAAA